MVEGDVTRLLSQWAGGDPSVQDSLAEIVYAELHKIASGYLRREDQGHTLQPTALVNEAWLRLVRQDLPELNNRKHFFALAAQIMRRILVDHARTMSAAKRGGGARPETVGEAIGSITTRSEEFLALDDALADLARYSERKARVIELRYFGGLSVAETAEMLGVSIATITREQRTAEAWLSQAMSAQPPAH